MNAAYQGILPACHIGHEYHRFVSHGLEVRKERQGRAGIQHQSQICVQTQLLFWGRGKNQGKIWLCWPVAEPSECTLTSAQQSGFQPQLQSLHVQSLNFLNLYIYTDLFYSFGWVTNSSCGMNEEKVKSSFFLRKPNFIWVGCKRLINHDIFLICLKYEREFECV